MKYLGNNQILTMGGKNFQIWDSNDGTCSKSMTFNNKLFDTCLQLPDRRLIISSVDDSRKPELLLVNLDSGDLTTTPIDRFIMCMEIIDETRLACIKVPDVLAQDENFFALLNFTVAKRESPGYLSIFSIEDFRFRKISEAGGKEFGRIFCMKAIPDNLLALGHALNRKVSIYDHEKGIFLRKIKNFGFLLDYLSSYDVIASAEGRFSIKMWNYKSGKCVREIDEEGQVNQVEFTPDGHHVVVSAYGYVRVYDSVEFKCIRFVLLRELAGDDDVDKCKRVHVLDNNRFAFHTENEIKIFDFKDL